MSSSFWTDPDDALFARSLRQGVTYLPVSWSAGVLEAQQYTESLEPQQQPHLLTVSGRFGGTGSGVAVTNRNIRGRWPACVALPWLRRGRD